MIEEGTVCDRLVVDDVENRIRETSFDGPDHRGGIVGDVDQRDIAVAVSRNPKLTTARRRSPKSVLP